MEVDKDHIHILVSSEPKVAPLQIVRVIKQITTRQLWIKYENALCKHFWKERTFWTDGYFVSTIGNVSESTIINYIRNQRS